MTSVPCSYFYSLFDVARTINSSLSLPEVLTRVAESTARAMQAKACSIRLLSAIDNSLTISAVYGLSEEYLAKGPVQVRNSAVDREALLGNVVAIEDSGSDRRLQYPAEAEREGIKSMLVAPLECHGNALGVIRVYTAERREFTQFDKDLLRFVAELSAIAICNARAFDTLKHELKTVREARAARRAALSAAR